MKISKYFKTQRLCRPALFQSHAVLKILSLAGCAGMLAACGGSAASTSHSQQSAAAKPTASPSTQAFTGTVAQLIPEAAKEGRLSLSWSSTFADNGKQIAAFQNAFNQFYGLHLKFTDTAAPTMTQMASEIIQDAKANSPAPTDLYIGGSAELLALMNGNAVQPYPWQTMAQEVGVSIPKTDVTPQNAGVGFSTDVYGVVYNTHDIPPSQVPHTLQGWLAPQWKGKIASTPYLCGLYNLAGKDPNWGFAKTKVFITALSHQVGGLIRGGDKAPLLSGQFDAMVDDCDINDAILAQRQGEPLGYVVPSDGPTVDVWMAAVPKTSRDPAAAALLTTFLLTPEGQKLSWQIDGNDLYFLPNSHDRQILNQAVPKSSFIAGLGGVQYLQQTPQFSQYDKELVGIITHASSKG